MELTAVAAKPENDWEQTRQIQSDVRTQQCGKKTAMRAFTLGLLVFLLGPPADLAHATVVLSLDTTVEVSGTTFADQEALSDNLAGSVSLLPLGTLPDPADVDAHHLFANGDQLYSLDTTADLGGGLTTGAADVVRFDGTTDTIEFDASAEGIPDGVIVDAVTVHDSGDLILSFDTTVDLGGGVIAGDEDLVRFDGLSTYAVFFDGSAQGIASGLDLDGAGFRASDGHLLVSFDVSGSVGGVGFDDEDILEFDPSGPSWSLVYDGSALHGALGAADVVALPEPESWMTLMAGAALLCALYWWRIGVSRIH